MSYFDPEVYNYEALKPEHKQLIDIYGVAEEDALNRDYIIDDVMGLGSLGGGRESVIDRMKREIAEEVFDAIEEYMESQKLQHIVSIMDNDEDYYERAPEDGQ